MSRSRRHHAICGISCAKSEKQDKRIYNRILRHTIKQALKYKDTEELEGFVFPKKDEVMNIWSMAKDGKQRINKDSFFYNKCLRNK